MKGAKGARTSNSVRKGKRENAGSRKLRVARELKERREGK